MLYLPWKAQVRSIINKHFPPEIGDRFTMRSDSEIYIPSFDEGVWKRKKQNRESLHILFDGLELFEIPQWLDKRFAELAFLKSFKEAIIDGRISFDKKIEWTDNAKARKNKRELQQKKADKLLDSLKEATYLVNKYKNPTKSKSVILPTKGKVKKYEMKGGV